MEALEGASLLQDHDYVFQEQMNNLQYVLK